MLLLFSDPLNFYSPLVDSISNKDYPALQKIVEGDPQVVNAECWTSDKPSCIAVPVSYMAIFNKDIPLIKKLVDIGANLDSIRDLANYNHDKNICNAEHDAYVRNRIIALFGEYDNRQWLRDLVAEIDQEQEQTRRAKVQVELKTYYHMRNVAEQILMPTDVMIHIYSYLDPNGELTDAQLCQFFSDMDISSFDTLPEDAKTQIRQLALEKSRKTKDNSSS